MYLLNESALGYVIMEVSEADVVAGQTDQVVSAMAEFVRFSKLVKLKAFAPFKSAAHALEDANLVSEGMVSDYLKNFLETNVPLSKKKSKMAKLGVHRDPKMKSAVAEALNGQIEVVVDEHVDELLRGTRMHLEKFVDSLKSGDAVKAQLGLAHSYSRAKVKFNVHKSDNMIIQSIALLDQLDKDINTFAMRVREWYSWHFPELAKVITDNIQYARAVKVIRNKSSVNDDTEEALKEVLLDEDMAKDVIIAARSSMGTDVSDIDLVNIEMFASRVVQLAEYRASLQRYLESKMSAVAPNLAALIGEHIGARLISHAGSLTSLAKYPASTVQILGAEKALFRALKTKGKTPKYGLLYNSTFIGRAKLKNKGRISRYIANKCSIASRMDCFSEHSTDVFGKKLREQVEERLAFYEKGSAPRKNMDVMKEALEEAGEADEGATTVEVKIEKDGGDKDGDVAMLDNGDEEMKTPEVKKEKKSKKKKSEKKEKKDKSDKKKRSRKSLDGETEAAETPKKMEVDEPVEKKRKKKDKKSRKSIEA